MKAAFQIAEELFDGLLIPRTRVANVPWSFSFSEDDKFKLSQLSSLFCIVEDGMDQNTLLYIDTFCAFREAVRMLSDRMPQKHRIYQFKASEWLVFKQLGTR